MIRFINVVRRREDITEAEFRQYWDSDEFAELVAGMARAVGAEHYQYKRTLIVEANENIRRLRGGADPFDGVVEYWFSGRVTGIDELLAMPDTRDLLTRMNDFQSRFADLTRSSGFFTEG